MTNPSAHSKLAAFTGQKWLELASLVPGACGHLQTWPWCSRGSIPSSELGDAHSSEPAASPPPAPGSSKLFLGGFQAPSVGLLCPSLPPSLCSPSDSFPLLSILLLILFFLFLYLLPFLSLRVETGVCFFHGQLLMEGEESPLLWAKWWPLNSQVWKPSPHYFRMWLHLEGQPLQR